MRLSDKDVRGPFCNGGATVNGIAHTCKRFSIYIDRT